MGRWGAKRRNTALSTTADFMTLVSLSARGCEVYLVEFAGMGTASAANEVIVARSSGGTTGGGAITPEPLRGEQAAAAGGVPAARRAVMGTGVGANLAVGGGLGGGGVGGPRGGGEP